MIRVSRTPAPSLVGMPGNKRSTTRWVRATAPKLTRATAEAASTVVPFTKTRRETCRNCFMAGGPGLAATPEDSKEHQKQIYEVEVEDERALKGLLGVRLPCLTPTCGPQLLELGRVVRRQPREN